MLEQKVREIYKIIFEEMVMPVIDNVITEESANTEILIREAIQKRLGTVSMASSFSPKNMDISQKMNFSEEHIPIVVSKEKVVIEKSQEDSKSQKMNFSEERIEITVKKEKEKEISEKSPEDMQIEKDIMEDLEYFNTDVKKESKKTEKVDKKDKKAEKKAEEKSTNDDDFDLDLEGMLDDVVSEQKKDNSSHLVVDDNDLDELENLFKE